MALRFTPTDPAATAVTERADAARNRRRVLEAAERLFAERCPTEVTLDEVARVAGVGKGTIYRRFGDRAGLALAVLDAREREIQEQVLRGPPPLGPGAPPDARLRAFLGALAGMVVANLRLMVVAENATAGARYRTQVYAGQRLHVAVLLREGLGADPGLLPDLVLAPLAADLVGHLVEERGVRAEDLTGALDALVDRVLACGPPPSGTMGP
ncbi:MAG: TetR/AcrR family transcriptional regulator [Thermoleophilia bacterium]|jgi:AcrR family transcriptional regulator|nr:TetR/AcrR family transcriptional regulator [Thermoleophilia bacterium]